MTRVGTLKELDVKPGDVVFDFEDEKERIIKSVKVIDGNPFKGDLEAEFFGGEIGIFTDEQFRIISRAGEEPKPSADNVRPWKDLTDEEKGALLLAHHEGKVIEKILDANWTEVDPYWADDVAYRVKPEPVRETVRISTDGKTIHHERFFSLPFMDATHYITFDLIDGKPDCGSIKMEEV